MVNSNPGAVLASSGEKQAINPRGMVILLDDLEDMDVICLLYMES